MIAAMPPKVMKISKTPVNDRMKACRKPIEPPSSRTIREPTASFPSDLPWLAVSTAVGITTRQSTRAATLIAVSRAWSSPN